jgi:hypothetical protein
MAGMLPKRRTRDEIEREMERLREGHQRSVESWLKNRFADNANMEDECSSMLAGANAKKDE